jgi:hypothetical protein
VPRASDLLGLGAATAAAATVLLALPGVARVRSRRPLSALLATILLPLVPLGTLPAAGYVRGVLGDLSVTTTLLLLHHLLGPVFGLRAIGERSRVALQVLAAMGGLVLYPPALGLGPTDVYRLGFAHPGFVWAVLLLAAVGWLGRSPFVAACLALGFLAWAGGVLESRNLWDYLLDPVVAVWGLGALLQRLARVSLRALARRAPAGVASA